MGLRRSGKSFFKSLKDKLRGSAKGESSSIRSTEYEDSLSYYRQKEKSTALQQSDMMKYFTQLKEMRLKEDSVKEAHRSLVEEANEAAVREEQVSLQFSNRRRILLSNINILPSRDFSGVSEFLHYFRSINFAETPLKEDNIILLLNGFLAHAGEVDSSELSTPNFQAFLTQMRARVEGFESPQTLLLLTRLLDVTCVDYPELWAKVERKTLKIWDKLSLESALTTIKMFANQGEGTEDLYLAFEAKLKEHRDSLELSQIVDSMQCFFNSGKGTVLFMDQLLELTLEKLRTLPDPDFIALGKLCVVLSGFSKDFAGQRNVPSLYVNIGRAIARAPHKLTPESACYFGLSFGFERGSKRFLGLLMRAAEQRLPTKDPSVFRESCEGFLFTYRADEEFLDKLLQDWEPLIPSLSPGFLAKMDKSLYIIEQEKRPASAVIQAKVLGLLKTQAAEMPIEDLIEIALAYNLTRSGSREFYRVLELVLKERLDEIARQPETLEKLIRMYTESGLCNIAFLEKMREFSTLP